MEFSPQVILFILFMLAVVQATRIDEIRQKKRELRAQQRGHAHVPTRP